MRLLKKRIDLVLREYTIKRKKANLEKIWGKEAIWREYTKVIQSRTQSQKVAWVERIGNGRNDERELKHILWKPWMKGKLSAMTDNPPTSISKTGLFPYMPDISHADTQSALQSTNIIFGIPVANED